MGESAFALFSLDDLVTVRVTNLGGLSVALTSSIIHRKAILAAQAIVR